MSEELNLEQNDQQRIINNNLLSMKTNMRELLFKESIGGNAGKVEIDDKVWPCCAANGYADKETGEILVFGNTQDVSPDIYQNPKNGSIVIKLAVNMRPKNQEDSFFKIVDFIREEGFSVEAIYRVNRAIAKYNEDFDRS